MLRWRPAGLTRASGSAQRSGRRELAELTSTELAIDCAEMRTRVTLELPVCLELKAASRSAFPASVFNITFPPRMFSSSFYYELWLT